MKSKYDYDIIRDYLHGLVDRKTAHEVRELIRTDDVARNIALGILQLEHEFDGDESQIDSYIEDLRQKRLKLINKKDNTRSISKTWMRLAAAILIIAIAAPVLWITLFKKDIVASELSEPYPLAVVSRSDANLNEGFKFYNQGNYKKAIDEFDKQNDDVSVAFYNGLSHLYVGEYDEAISLLNSPLLEASAYYQQALWYKTLALIKSGKTAEAKKNLERISNETQHYRSAEARELLSSYKE